MPGDVTANRRCPECGEIGAGITPRPSRGGWRVAVSLGVAIALLGGLAVIAHRSRQSLRMSSGVPMGRAVEPNFTLLDVSEIADGSRDGAGLFEGVFAIGEGWTGFLPGDLRLLPEFPDRLGTPSDPLLMRHAISGQVTSSAAGVPLIAPSRLSFTPILWSELEALTSRPDRDRALAQRLLGPNAAVADALAGRERDHLLAITPQPEATMAGTHTVWTLGVELLTLESMRFSRDRRFGPSEAMPPLEPRRLARWFDAGVQLDFLSGDSSIQHRLTIPHLAVLCAIGALSLAWAIVWLALGGWVARRTRLRQARGACLACGYQLAR